MSIRTKNPAGSARSRILRTLSMAVAVSTSSPSWVSLSDTFRDGPSVVTQHGAFAHAEQTSFRHHDAAELEWFGRFLNGLSSAADAEIGMAGGELLEETIDAIFEIAARNRRSHGRGEYGG